MKSLKIGVKFLNNEIKTVKNELKRLTHETDITGSHTISRLKGNLESLKLIKKLANNGNKKG